MNRFNPDKLLLSKWTATQPQNKEKHFLITELQRDEEGVVLQVELQAVYSKRSQWLDWRELRDDQIWRLGWQ
ncbi:TIGR02450 family Trp-rich protein [Stutzerimonas stutzeri]|uniref:TIGR02450 family Trp-rich protein n=1 Tax=Stutzerimonas stutzeri TaxID=316 RepID=UPI00210DD287|nr:TIGR02450 family Trp-rich protein [Stutzerimonas stutzeri]MCQ4258918.1 TIGR02450 family Trp-rich protein [Stutzerimonas stutzeri]